MSENQKSEIRNQKSLDEAERNQKSEVRNRKSLDDVIEVFEQRCCQGCDKCPYYPDDCLSYLDEPLSDAVFYLKEYRSEKAMWEADRKGYLDWIEQYKEARDRHQQAVIKLKRKPVKVINIYPVGNYLFGSCGSCGAPVIKHDVYCSECGAKLDWSENEGFNQQKSSAWSC